MKAVIRRVSSALALAGLMLAAPVGRASLEENGTWEAGVWATTVWADGVWYEGPPQTSAIPAAEQQQNGFINFGVGL